MQPLDHYKALKEFYLDVEKSRFHPFPLKIMGKSRANEKFTASMMSVVYQDTDDPDRAGIFPVQACFGSIHKKGCRIDLQAAYSTVSSEADGMIHLYQGDVIPLQLYQFNKTMPKHTCSMVLSHSCEIDRACSILVAPVFLESELSQKTMEFLKNDKVKNLSATVANWLNNESSKYVGFPACDVLNASSNPEALVSIY
ncbi:MAG: hypothetical protein HRU09_07885 [Oligoflexales bacterium]|nr:hypothetical protein [Oligoflexales bacterium]